MLKRLLLDAADMAAFLLPVTMFALVAVALGYR